jgi:hypothetical protein
MQLFSEYVQWQNFAATEFAMAEVEEERAESALRTEEATQLVLTSPKPGYVQATQAMIKATPEVQRAKDRALDAYARRKMTGVMRDNCERTAALLSRELSRRIGGADVQRRQMRWQP